MFTFLGSKIMGGSKRSLDFKILMWTIKKTLKAFENGNLIQNGSCIKHFLRLLKDCVRGFIFVILLNIDTKLGIQHQ